MQQRFKTMREAEDFIRPRLTDEFLCTLQECLSIQGWDQDFVETSQFVKAIFKIAGHRLDPFDVEIYEYED